jgi:hypothetical protein
VQGLSNETIQFKKELKRFLPEQCRNCRKANTAALEAASVAVKKCLSPQEASVHFTENVGYDCELGTTVENEGLCNERPVCNHPREEEIGTTKWEDVFSR